jgi:transposase
MRIGRLAGEAETLKRERRNLIGDCRPELLVETGCGPLAAAMLIGQIAAAERVKSDAHCPRPAGVASIPVSSVRQDRIAWSAVATRATGLPTSAPSGQGAEGSGGGLSRRRPDRICPLARPTGRGP